VARAQHQLNNKFWNEHHKPPKAISELMNLSLHSPF